LKVVRTFTIINWCLYEAGGETVTITRDENQHGLVEQSTIITSKGYENVGKLEYIQVLKLQDDTAPIIRVEDTDTCLEGETCSAKKRFAITATDCNETATETLTYNWALSSEGTQLAIGEGASFEANVSTASPYTVTWTVADNCGNTAQEKQNYVFKDCKKPSPYCLHGVAVELMEDSRIQVWASDLDINRCSSTSKSD